MSSLEIAGSSVRSLTPPRIRGYAKALGWKRIEVKTDVPVALFEHPQHAGRQLLVPTEQGSPDYENRVKDVIRTLSQIADLRPSDILIAIINYQSDVLRFSVASELTEGGHIPLDQGIDLLKGAQRALLASACSVLHPAKHHPRMSRADAIQFLQKCQLGQTERGSFVATVLCPLEQTDPQDKLFNDDTEPPFARSVTQLLVTSLQHVVSAIDADRIESVLKPEGAQPVVSANLCEAILAMQPVGTRGTLSLGATWSPSFMPLMNPQTVRVTQDHFPKVELIYNELRPHREEGAVEQFVALVSTLNGTADADGRMCGEVTLTLFRDDDNIRARADLSTADYETADRAHMSHSLVSFKAQLIPAGRRTHRLEDPREFKILPP